MPFVSVPQRTRFVYTSSGAEVLTTQAVIDFESAGMSIPEHVSITAGSDVGGTYTVESSVDLANWDDAQTIVATAGNETTDQYINCHRYCRITCPTSATHIIRVAWRG